MKLESLHQSAEKTQHGSVIVQCRIFRQYVLLDHIRRLQHEHDQDQFEGNYLKYVPIHDSSGSSILEIKLNHISWV